VVTILITPNGEARLQGKDDFWTEIKTTMGTIDKWNFNHSFRPKTYLITAKKKMDAEKKNMQRREN